MLVLQRKVGESFLLVTSEGERIEIIFLKRAGNRLHIGIEAPGDVHVVRSEIADRIPDRIVDGELHTGGIR